MTSTSRRASGLLLFVTLLMMFGLQTSAFAQAADRAAAQAKARKIDELMTLYHSLGQFNGSVLVAEKGEVIFKKAYGLANMEWGIPNAPDTKFRLGSITSVVRCPLPH